MIWLNTLIPGVTHATATPLHIYLTHDVLSVIYADTRGITEHLGLRGVILTAMPRVVWWGLVVMVTTSSQLLFVCSLGSQSHLFDPRKHRPLQASLPSPHMRKSATNLVSQEQYDHRSSIKVNLARDPRAAPQHNTSRSHRTAQHRHFISPLAKHHE